MKSINKWMHSTFLKFMLNYCCIIFVVTITFLPIYQAAIRTVQENAIKDVQRLLDDKLVLIDNQLAYLENVAVSLRNSSNFSLLNTVKSDNISPNHYYFLSEAQNYLRNVLILPYMAWNSYFVYQQNNIVISRDIICSVESESDNSMFLVSNKRFLNWKNSITFDRNSTFQPQLIISKGNDPLLSTGGLEVLPYIIPVSNSVTKKYDSALITFINVDRLQQILVNDDAEYKYLYLADNEGHILYDYNGNSDISIIDNMGSSKDITQLKSQISNSGLKIVAGIDNNIFKRNLSEVRSNITTYFIWSIILGIFASIFLSYKNNIPIRNLARTLKTISLSIDYNENILNNSDKALRHLDGLKATYKNQMEMLDISYKANLFDKLISGTVSGEQDVIYLNRHFEFLSHPYVIAVIKLNYNILNHDNPISEEYNQTLSVVLSEIAQDAMPNLEYVHNIMHQKLIFVISIPQSENQSWEKKVVNDLYTLTRYIENRTGKQIMVGMSQKGTSYTEVSALYRQAWDILRFRLGVESYAVVMYNQSNSELSLIEEKDVQKIHEMINAGETQEVLSTIDNVYQQLASLETINEKLVMRVYYSVQNVLFFASKDIVNKESFPFLPMEYSSEEALSEMFNNLKFNASELCNAVKNQKKLKNTQFVETLQEYIETNFKNPNLSITMLSDHFQLSEKYLFALVKNQTGKSVGSYIEDIRMDQAMKLLLNTSLTVGEISLECGFNSPNTFFKAFKRYTGVSPGVWRENRKEN